jgi:hypothetical protein
LARSRAGSRKHTRAQPDSFLATTQTAGLIRPADHGQAITQQLEHPAIAPAIIAATGRDQPGRSIMHPTSWRGQLQRSNSFPSQPDGWQK